jgi:predicted nucleic acid-binding protein
MIGLLDSSVVIDVLREHPPAENWLKSQGQLGVTRIVWLEVIEGAFNKRKQREALKLLRRFALVELTTPDMIWAVNTLIRTNLGYNVDAFDCLIASVSHRLQLPMYTTNMKHFTPLLGSLAQRPY